MDIHSSTLKAQARQAMKAARPHFFPMTLVYLLLTGATGMLVRLFFVDPLAQLLDFLQTGLSLPRALSLALTETGWFGLFLYLFVLIASLVFAFSYNAWCLGTTRGGIGEWRDLFSGFSMAGRVILLRLAVGTYILIWYMVLTMAAMMVSLLVTYFIPFGFYLTSPIFAAAIGFFFWKVLHYSMADFCLMDAPDHGVFHAIHESRLLMRGHCGQFLLMMLSFFGWWLLGFAIQLAAEGILLITLGGPWLMLGDIYGAMAAVVAFPLANLLSTAPYWLFAAWLVPYQAMTTARFYDTLRSDAQQQTL